MPDETKGSGGIRFLDDLDWSFRNKAKRDKRLLGIPAKWKAKDTEMTSIDVSLWFNQLSFVLSGILGALFEHFESAVDSLLEFNFNFNFWKRHYRFSHGQLFFVVLRAVPLSKGSPPFLSLCTPARSHTTRHSPFCLYHWARGVESGHHHCDPLTRILPEPFFVGHARKTSQGSGYDIDRSSSQRAREGFQTSSVSKFCATLFELQYSRAFQVSGLRSAADWMGRPSPRVCPLFFFRESLVLLCTPSVHWTDGLFSANKCREPELPRPPGALCQER